MHACKVHERKFVQRVSESAQVGSATLQSIAIKPPTNPTNPSVQRLIAERVAPPDLEAEGVGTALEGVLLLAATFEVPFICFAREANAAKERAEDSSELIASTIPAVR